MGHSRAEKNGRRGQDETPREADATHTIILTSQSGAACRSLPRDAQCCYSRVMKVGLALAAVLLLAAHARPGLPPEASPRELYQALTALRVSSHDVYSVKEIVLRRDVVKISLREGRLAFLQTCNGRITGAAFVGRGHALALVRDPVEKHQLNRFLGSPLLDQPFSTAYFRFTDQTAKELRQQLETQGVRPVEDAAFADSWNANLLRLNPAHSLRILADWLSANPLPYFYASVQGGPLGPFDILMDDRRSERVLVGQLRETDGQSFYDTWISLAHRDAPPQPALSYLPGNYVVDTTILPDRTLRGKTTLSIKGVRGGDRIVSLELSRFLQVQSVEDAFGHALDFFQNEAVERHDLAARGNNSLQVILPAPVALGQDVRLRLTYAGTVISDAGNGVYYVGERGSWYPHAGGPDAFSQFDLTFHWPRRLKLVATGKKVEEHEDSDQRVGQWRSEVPVSVAGFNLGDYASELVRQKGLNLELFANRALEQALVNRLQRSAPVVALPPALQRGAGTQRLEMPEVLPSPASALKQLGGEIADAVKFYERFSGPFPFEHLSISQIPGSFGQGWPGLLYLSTFSFLPAPVQQRAGLSAANQEHFTDLVPFHEVAHQWWGNVIGWGSYRDQWINEAIANYLALLYADSKKQPDRTLNVWLQRYRQRLTVKNANDQESGDEVGPLVLGYRLTSSKSPDGFERVLYAKGSWVIHMLRMMLRQPGAKNPDERFVQLLLNLIEKYRYHALSTENLQREAEALMLPSMALEGRHSLDWFFDQWVRGSGIPRYTVNYTVRKLEGGYQVRGTLHQGEATKSFLAHVPLFITLEGGKAIPLGTVETTGEETHFQFVAQRAPRKVLVDPQLTLLCVSP